MEPHYLISYDGKAQAIAADEMAALRIEADLLALGSMRETQDISIKKLPAFEITDAGPWLQPYHRATKTMFKDATRKITPNIHSWVRIRPSAYLTEEEKQCNRQNGLYHKVDYSNGKGSHPSATITVVGHDRDETVKLFHYWIDIAHQKMKGTNG